MNASQKTSSKRSGKNSERRYLKEIRLQFYVNDLAIYSAFMGEEIQFHPHKYNSPLRSDRNYDRVPSLVFQLGSNGRVYYRDYGKSDMEHPSPPDAINFVAALKTAETGIDMPRHKAVDLIWDMMINNTEFPTRVVAADPGPRPKMTCLHDASLRDFELKYWHAHWITERYLQFFQVHGLDELIASNGNTVAESTPRDPGYVYRWSNEPLAFQTYRPLTRDQKNKFRGQNNGHLLHGIDQLPQTADHLIIASSRKDVIILRRLGYLAVAPIGETTLKSLLAMIRELSGRFANIYILYDSDAAGEASARNLHNITDWHPIFIPRARLVCPKDPADLVLRTGNYFELSRFLSTFNLSRYHI